MCNAGGPGKEGYIGGSGVWMPLKGKLGGVEGEGVGMVVVDVDLTVLKVCSDVHGNGGFVLMDRMHGNFIRYERIGLKDRNMSYDIFRSFHSNPEAISEGNVTRMVTNFDSDRA